MIFLGAPEPSGLRDALDRPVEQLGYRFEPPGLVATMIEDLGTSPDALPLLQFAAARLWERRDRDARALTAEAYQAIGGVAGALAGHADQVVASLSPAARRLLRPVLLRLVTAEGTRAIGDLDELRGLGPPEEVDALIARLTEARLLVVGSGVELIHESLVASWPTLRRWREESSEDAAFLEQLRTVARQWHARGRDAGLLWHGEAADEARRFVARSSVPLPEREAAYLAAVIALADGRTRRRRIAIGAVMLALAAIAIGAVVVMLQLRRAEQEAHDKADDAERAAEVARAAETRATDELERARRAETAQQRAESLQQTAEQRAGEANRSAELSRAELEAANLRLERAVTDAEKAREVAETARAKAEAAAARSEKDAARIRALAEEADRARETAEALLEKERAHVKALEKELAAINTKLN
jgi:hypothetical protein